MGSGGQAGQGRGRGRIVAGVIAPEEELGGHLGEEGAGEDVLIALAQVLVLCLVFVKLGLDEVGRPAGDDVLELLAGNLSLVLSTLFR